VRESIEPKYRYRRRLDLSGIHPGASYKLLVVILPSEEGGYKMFAKRNHSWYLFDDKAVTKVKLAEVIKQTGVHVLIYEKNLGPV
jgi:ubiquitin C-terminal hydrolase